MRYPANTWQLSGQLPAARCASSRAHRALTLDGSRFPGPADILYILSYAVFAPSLLLLMGKRFP